MASPGISRSGRVLKKSVKLMDLDNEAPVKQTPPLRMSIPKLTVPKTVVLASSPSSSSIETTPNTNNFHPIGDHLSGAATDNKVSPTLNSQPKIILLPQSSLVSPKTPANSSGGNNLKFKLNLSGESIKLNPKPTQSVASKPSITPLKMTINSSMTGNADSSGKLTTPIKIISSETNSQKNTIVLKLKTDGSETKFITPVSSAQKRPLESPTPPETSKMIKIEAAKPIQINKPMIATQKIIPSTPAATATPKTVKIEPARKFFITKSIAPKPESGTPVKPTVITPLKQVNIVNREIKPKLMATPVAKPNIVPVNVKIATPSITLPSPSSSSSSAVVATPAQKRASAQRARGSMVQRPISPLPRANARPSARRPTARRTKGDNDDNDNDNEREKKKPAVSAYVLWCRESRSEMASRYPDLNFIDLSRKMGEIWHTLAQIEKDIWFKKAKKLTNSSVDADELYSQDWISDDLKPKKVSSKQTLPITAENTVNTFDETFSVGGEHVGVIDNQKHEMGTELIDVQAYLTILGDSLETIGSYLQRGVKYNSEIDYSKSTALSTLLDTALVAMGSLTCLTKAIPKIAPPQEKLSKTLDDVSYFMPPTDLSYNA